MRRIIVALVAVVSVAAVATPAMADHTHVRMTGAGSCVILAAAGGENEVSLPHADEFAENRRHPLHVNVHLGQPGMRQGEEVIRL
ncbi:MAG: hypothetical protein L0Z47_10430 [Actinobacteria bacterium]|nr:hypothetical protein [Actinomycetota bacterium]